MEDPKHHERPIVICDDNDDILQAFAMNLRHDGYNVRTAHSYQELLPLLKHPKPALLILDIRMPEMDGFDILEEMTAMNLKIPVFMMTAHDHFMYRNYAPIAHVREYLVKPVDPEELLAKIKKLLDEPKPA